MTDQPDHRAEAVRWLIAAEGRDILSHDEEPGRTDGSPDAIVAALIGIGHAILAAFPDDDGGWEGLPPGDVEVNELGYVGGAEDRRPHSRACGPLAHPHGPRCHYNCPTCGHVPVEYSPTKG
jgi:hypothetical protein